MGAQPPPFFPAAAGPLSGVTTLNGNTFTAGSYTLTGAAGKVLTFSATLSLAGTDGAALNIGAGGTLASGAFGAAFDATAVAITGGTINGTAIGGSTRAAAAVTTLAANGAATMSAAGAASTPALILTGAILTGGTGTTNFPHLLVQPTGATAATTWSANGTAIGVNAQSGFTGSLVDLRINGGASILSVVSGGVNCSGVFSVPQTGVGFTWSSGSRFASPANGVITLFNAASSDFSRLQFGGVTASFPAIKRSGTTLAFRLADDSGDAPISAASAVFSGAVVLGSFTVATVPSAATFVRGLIWASNAAAGAWWYGSDGTNWRRLNTEAILS